MNTFCMFILPLLEQHQVVWLNNKIQWVGLALLYLYNNKYTYIKYLYICIVVGNFILPNCIFIMRMGIKLYLSKVVWIQPCVYNVHITYFIMFFWEYYRPIILGLWDIFKCFKMTVGLDFYWYIHIHWIIEY